EGGKGGGKGGGGEEGQRKSAHARQEALHRDHTTPLQEPTTRRRSAVEERSGIAVYVVASIAAKTGPVTGNTRPASSISSSSTRGSCAPFHTVPPVTAGGDPRGVDSESCPSEAAARGTSPQRPGPLPQPPRPRNGALAH